jgi:hypothetical protein
VDIYLEGIYSPKSPQLGNELAEAGDSCSFHDRRFLLPHGEPAGFFNIDIHALEHLAISIVNGHAPMMMLTMAINAELGVFSPTVAIVLLPAACPVAKR